MEEADQLHAEEGDFPEEDAWGEFMADHIADLISNLNPGLAANDYSLNSPLISDRIDAILTKIHTGHTSSQFASNQQFLRSALLLKTHVTMVDWARVKGATEFHEWVTHAIYQGRAQTRHFEKMLQQCRPAAMDAAAIITAFWKSTTGTDLSPDDLFRGNFEYYGLGYKALGWGEKFWVAHTLVNIINAATSSEASALLRSTPWIESWAKDLKDEKEFCLMGNADGFGRFVAIPGWLFLRDHNRLLDRNMLLMIKDVLIARYCSCVSVWKTGDPNARKNLEKLIALYDGGDAVLCMAGNNGFRILKMLEAHCSLQWTLLGHKKRPEIPLSPAFADHLKRARKLLQTYAEELRIEAFFECVLTETDPMMVGVYYGSFRHWGHPFIDYKEGLKKLHDQVHAPKTITPWYVKAFASDLARKVLESEFRKQRKWFVDESKLDDDHILKPFVRTNCWPPCSIIQAFGDKWDELPLLPCFEVPNALDPSEILSDCSHSPTRDELESWLKQRNHGAFKTHKVLETALHTKWGQLN